MDCIKKSVCGVVPTGRHNELITLKIRYLELILEEFLHIEFQQNTRNAL